MSYLTTLGSEGIAQIAQRVFKDKTGIDTTDFRLGSTAHDEPICGFKALTDDAGSLPNRILVRTFDKQSHVFVKWPFGDNEYVPKGMM